MRLKDRCVMLSIFPNTESVKPRIALYEKVRIMNAELNQVIQNIQKIILHRYEGVSSFSMLTNLRSLVFLVLTYQEKSLCVNEKKGDISLYILCLLILSLT